MRCSNSKCRRLALGLLQFRQVSTKTVDFLRLQSNSYPLLFCAAMDVLQVPTHAFAVPCEGVISSSKETDTNHRAKLSPEHMEHLQIFKFGYWRSRATFTDDLLENVGNYEVSIVDDLPGIISDLYQEGRITELNDLEINLGRLYDLFYMYLHLNSKIRCPLKYH